MLPGLLISLVHQLLWNSLKSISVSAHPIQFVLNIFLAPHTNQSPCSLCSNQQPLHSFNTAELSYFTHWQITTRGLHDHTYMNHASSISSACAHKTQHDPLWMDSNHLRKWLVIELVWIWFSWMRIECGRDQCVLIRIECALQVQCRQAFRREYNRLFFQHLERVIESNTALNYTQPPRKALTQMEQHLVASQLAPDYVV